MKTQETHTKKKPWKQKRGNHDTQASTQWDKTAQTEQYETNHVQKYCFEMAIYSWTWGLPLSAVSIPCKTPWEITKFSFESGYQLEIASCWGMGACVYFSFSTLIPHLFWTLQSLCLLLVSMNLYVPRSCCYWQILFPWGWTSSLTLAIFLSALSQAHFQEKKEWFYF